MNLHADAQKHGMMVMGHLSEGAGSIVLIGAAHEFWTHFINSPEYTDGQKDPIDRYSKRVIEKLADGAAVSFPSDGPPYAPFIAWAIGSGRFWQSPTGMMVHDVAGLMISIRGAIHINGQLAHKAAASPCDSCQGQPCVSACPVTALGADIAYDVPKCKAYLDTQDGDDCMSNGCAVRRACPISQSFDRPNAQSAFHMQAFHPKT